MLVFLQTLAFDRQLWKIGIYCPDFFHTGFCKTFPLACNMCYINCPNAFGLVRVWY